VNRSYIAVRNSIGYLGLHLSLLAAMIGLLFLQRYLWLVQLAEKGYGPYITVSSIGSVVVIAVLVDLIVLRSALRGSRHDRIISLLVPAAFVGLSLFILIANNA
jgi:hypothetical protein